MSVSSEATPLSTRQDSGIQQGAHIMHTRTIAHLVHPGATRCFLLDAPGVSRFHEIPEPAWKRVLEASRTAYSTLIPLNTPDTGIQVIPDTLRPLCSQGIMLPSATIIALDRSILDGVYFECSTRYHGHGHPYHTRNFPGTREYDTCHMMVMGC